MYKITPLIFIPPELLNHPASWSWKKSVAFNFWYRLESHTSKGHQPIFQAQKPFPLFSCTAQGSDCLCFSLLLWSLPSSILRQPAGDGKKMYKVRSPCLLVFSPFSCLPSWTWLMPSLISLVQPYLIWRNLHFTPFVEVPNIQISGISSVARIFQSFASLIELEVKGQMVKEGGRQKYVGSICIESIKS